MDDERTPWAPYLRGRAVHLLDGPYVTVAGQRIEVPESSKQLLAFIALRGQRVERLHAAGVLWPVCDDRRAAGNLRTALWRLRGAGIDVFDVDRTSLGLAADVTVDVQVVAQWADRLTGSRPLPGDLTLSVRGPDRLQLLPGCDDEWALADRERIRQQLLHALDALSRHLTAAGRFAESVQAAMLAISAEPLRESAQQALIEAHLAEGNVGEARRAYQVFSHLLRRELGVAPSPRLRSVVDSRWSSGRCRTAPRGPAPTAPRGLRATPARS